MTYLGKVVYIAIFSIAILWLSFVSAYAAPPSRDLVLIPGGAFTMGDKNGEPDEVLRKVTVQTFRLMRFEVTNRDFAKFAAETFHITDPERSGIGHVWKDKWRAVKKADWRHPQGPGSTILGLDDHPVVQVSARDATAYCRWHGLRLPNEQEWEFAARGPEARKYPWGNAPPVGDGVRRAKFGTLACCAPYLQDGFERTAPIGHFAKGRTSHGVFDLAGNVWEWTMSPYKTGRNWQVIRGGGWGNNQYCLRASYRHGNPPDIGLDMVGFRCAGN